MRVSNRPLASRSTSKWLLSNQAREPPHRALALKPFENSASTIKHPSLVDIDMLLRYLTPCSSWFMNTNTNLGPLHHQVNQRWRS